MQNSGLPTKMPVPFANGASGSYKRQVAATSQIGINAGWASFPDGFPPLNFTNIGAGGVPIFGQDLNGILNQLTQWSRWQNAGGMVTYDGTFATSVGGYPKGAILAAASFTGNYWYSTVENNTSDPDAGGAGWLPLSSAMLNYAAATSVSANVITASIPTYPALITGTAVAIKINITNTGAATLNVSGLGAKPVTCAGAALTAGTLVAGQIYQFYYDGANWQAQTTPVQVSTHNFTTADGWELAPSGKMTQWGQNRNFFTGEGQTTITFPTTFPNACVSMQITTVNLTSSVYRDVFMQTVSRTTTGAVVRYQTKNDPSDHFCEGFDWFAVGY